MFKFLFGVHAKRMFQKVKTIKTFVPLKSAFMKVETCNYYDSLGVCIQILKLTPNFQFTRNSFKYKDFFI